MIMNYFFTCSVLSFVGGVALCSILDLGIYFGLFLILVSGVLFLLLRRDLSNSDSDKSRLLLLMILFFGLGFLRCSISNETKNQDFLDNFDDEISLIGIVVDEPDERENNTKLTLKIQKSDAKVLLTVPHYPQFDYGDEIQVLGTLQKPQNFKTDSGRTFDYINYLAKDRIFYQMFYPKTELVSQGNGNWVKEKLFLLKHSFLEKLQKTIPEPQVSLMGGLLLGTKQSLGQELQEDFRKVGLIHIVVLSGYNVSIIAEFIMNFFAFLPRMIGLGMGALSIVLFAIMVGGSATIVRASFMALLVVLARATGRTSEVTRALFLAGFVMVLHNPQIVVFDPSFQLSFVATLGLIVLSPKISEYFKFIPEKWHLRESAVATVSTQIFVLPLLLFMMGELSLVAVVVNLLVLMLIPVTMLFGFLTGLISFIWTGLALPFSYITHFLLTYELKVVELFANIPFASIRIPYFPFWIMIFIYVIYFLLIVNIHNRQESNL